MTGGKSNTTAGPSVSHDIRAVYLFAEEDALAELLEAHLGAVGLKVTRLATIDRQILESKLSIVVFNPRSREFLELEQRHALPVSADELHSERRAPDELCAGGVRLVRSSQSVAFGLRNVRLSGLEYRLLELLLERPAQVLSRDAIREALWGAHSRTSLRTVDVHIARLRRALGSHRPSPIRTVRGLGYILDG